MQPPKKNNKIIRGKNLSWQNAGNSQAKVTTPKTPKSQKPRNKALVRSRSSFELPRR